MTPDKLAAWLKEDILLRRVKVSVRRGPRSAAQQQKSEQEDADALVEAKALAETLEVPLSEVPALLADDREGYVPPAAGGAAPGGGGRRQLADEGDYGRLYRGRD